MRCYIIGGCRRVPGGLDLPLFQRHVARYGLGAQAPKLKISPQTESNPFSTIAYIQSVKRIEEPLSITLTSLPTHENVNEV